MVSLSWVHFCESLLIQNFYNLLFCDLIELRRTKRDKLRFNNSFEFLVCGIPESWYVFNDVFFL